MIPASPQLGGETSRPAAPSGQGRDGFGTDGLDTSIEHGLRLAGAAAAFALQFGLNDLGEIELPPAYGSAADQEALRTVAPLYLAAELEAARLLPATEAFAGVFVSGGIAADLGPVAERVVQFWRTRRDRFSAAERRAFFARVFGRVDGPADASPHGVNRQFENLLIDLADALFQLDQPAREPGTQPQSRQARLRVAAAALADNLIPRSGGLTGMAARDVLDATQTALQLLREPTLQRAVGASSVWMAVRMIARRYLSEEPEISAHVTRGRTGLLLLAWLAESLPRLDGSAGLAAPGDEAVSASAAWLEASLALHESHANPRT